MSVWQQAAQTVRSGHACVLVTILQTAGSAPREAGTRMLVTAQGQTGSIGGGNLEYVVTGQARALLASGETFRVQSYPLGPLLAQCCGGRVRVLLERLDAAQLDFLQNVCAAESQSLGIETVAVGGRLYNRLVEEPHCATHLCDSQGRQVDIQAPLEDGFVFAQALTALPPLLIFGAGHIGQAVARIAAILPFRTQWFDERASVIAAPAIGLAVVQADGEAAVAAAPAGALYLIVTHSHTLDYALVRAILRRGDFRYCGLIGSKTKRIRFQKRLLADGITPHVCESLKCPVGLSGLTSKLPQVIAVAIAAELLLEVQDLMQPVTAPAIVASQR